MTWNTYDKNLASSSSRLRNTCALSCDVAEHPIYGEQRQHKGGQLVDVQQVGVEVDGRVKSRRKGSPSPQEADGVESHTRRRIFNTLMISVSILVMSS